MTLLPLEARVPLTATHLLFIFYPQSISGSSGSETTQVNLAVDTAIGDKGHQETIFSEYIIPH